MLDRTTPLAIAFAALSLISPVSASAQSYPPSVTELIANARAQVKIIDMASFKSALDNKSLGLVVDVREPDEYADGHIPGAINIPRGQIELKIWPYVGFPDKLDLKKRITLYCGSGARCVLAAKSLKELQFSDVTAVDMHIKDWTAAGYPWVLD